MRKKRPQKEGEQNKISFEELKKQNKELKVKNEELLKELQEMKRLNSIKKKEVAIQYKAGKEQDDARNQQKIGINYVERLEKKLEESNKKVIGLERVLKAYQLEIKKYKDEILMNDKQQNIELNNKKIKNPEVVIKMLILFINLRKSAIVASNYLNSFNNKKARAAFDNQLDKLKNENNVLIKSSTVVKIVKRSFEVLEKDLQRIREVNNLKLKSARDQASDALIKGETVYTQVMINFPESFKTSIEECIRKLEELTKINLDSLYESEHLLQEQIIKKLENEKELLTIILCKQNDI